MNDAIREQMLEFAFSIGRAAGVCAFCADFLVSPDEVRKAMNLGFDEGLKQEVGKDGETG